MAVSHADSPPAPPTDTIGRRIVAMAWPTVVYSLLDSLMRVVDLILVGKLGKAAIAGVGLSQFVLFIVAILAMAVTSGATPIVSQAWGARDLDRVARLARQAIIVVCVIGGFGAVFYYLMARPAMAGFGAEPDIVPYAVAYMEALAWGIPFLFINVTMVALFRGIGQVRTPMVLAIIANILNAGLTWLLIGGIEGVIPPLGVAGAAIGTVTSRAVTALMALWIWRNRLLAAGAAPIPGLGWHFATLKPALPIGAAIGGMHLTRLGSQILFMVLVSHRGDTVQTAAANLVYQIRLTFIMMSLSINIALMTLVAHALGSGDVLTARRYTGRTVAGGLALIGSVAVLLIAFPGPLMDGMLALSGEPPDPALIASAVPMMRWAMLGQLFASAAIIASGALVAGGDTFLNFVFVLIAEWGFMAPIAYAIYRNQNIPLEHIWFSFLVSSVVMLVLTLVRYRQGKWMKRL